MIFEKFRKGMKWKIRMTYMSMVASQLSSGLLMFIPLEKLSIIIMLKLSSYTMLKYSLSTKLTCSMSVIIVLFFETGYCRYLSNYFSRIIFDMYQVPFLLMTLVDLILKPFFGWINLIFPVLSDLVDLKDYLVSLK